VEIITATAKINANAKTTARAVETLFKQEQQHALVETNAPVDPLASVESLTLLTLKRREI